MAMSTQEHLYEMSRVSFTLTKVLDLNPVLDIQQR